MNSEEKDILLKQLAEERSKKSDAMVMNILLSLFAHDLPIFDIHYIQKRAIEMFEYIYRQMKFHDEEILKQRRRFLEQCLQNAIAVIPKTQKPGDEQEPEVTRQRNRRCEPLAQEVVRSILNRELLLTDDVYVQGACEEQNQQMFQLLVNGYFQALFDGLEFSINESLLNANKILWDGTTKDKISFKQLDKVLKRTLPEKQKRV